MRRTSSGRSLRAGCAFARSPRCSVSNTVPSRLMTPFWRVPIGTSSEVGHSACRSGPRRPRAPAGGPPAAGCLVAASLLAVTLSAANLSPQTTRVVIRLWARSTRCSKLAHRPPAGTPVRLGGPRRPSGSGHTCAAIAGSIGRVDPHGGHASAVCALRGASREPIGDDVLAAGVDPQRADQATKYLAWGWWQTIATVVCSGSSCSPSLTLTPIAPAPSSSTTLALSASSGQAG